MRLHLLWRPGSCEHTDLYCAIELRMLKVADGGSRLPRPCHILMRGALCGGPPLLQQQWRPVCAERHRLHRAACDGACDMHFGLLLVRGMWAPVPQGWERVVP